MPAVPRSASAILPAKQVEQLVSLQVNLFAGKCLGLFLLLERHAASRLVLLSSHRQVCRLLPELVCRKVTPPLL